MMRFCGRVLMGSLAVFGGAVLALVAIALVAFIVSAPPRHDEDLARVNLPDEDLAPAPPEDVDKVAADEDLIGIAKPRFLVRISTSRRVLGDLVRGTEDELVNEIARRNNMGNRVGILYVDDVPESKGLRFILGLADMPYRACRVGTHWAGEPIQELGPVLATLPAPEVTAVVV